MRTGFVRATAPFSANGSEAPITARRPAALLGAVVVAAGLLAPVAPDPLPVPVRTVQLDVALTSVPALDLLTGVVTEIVKTVARLILLPALPVLIGAVIYQQTATCYSNSSCGRDPLFQLSGLIIKLTTALTASAEPAATQVPSSASRVTRPRNGSVAKPHRAHGTAAAARAKTPAKVPQGKHGQGHSARG
ncbi:hypothetical protein MHPYR_30191 [uncultured Mycobacterium sp.]|uniref:Uncharacterized protein n=1 Tax=uncultured Mycobacterium sp. TaxID=171292 RepID=A0A1Y5PBW3_9MYCO|nr:hypothetical protein MHPYR_30191 [uncultured Mycobacterium sp.]